MTDSKQIRTIYALGEREFGLIYGPQQRRCITQLTGAPDRVYTQEMLRHDPGVLAHVEFIFSGWGGPRIDEAFLERAPNLKLVLYGAGSLSSIASAAAWTRGVRFSTAAWANSIPVAEYSLAMIILGLKHVWRQAANMRREKQRPQRAAAPGCYGRTVGLVSMGAVARILAKKLAGFDLRVIAYDPFLSATDGAALGVEMVSLKHVFSTSHAVSLHTPLLEETRGLIAGDLIASMLPGATLINTSRGAIIQEEQLIKVARARPDLQFFLDVTDPEPPTANSPLYDLANVVLTPHLAGSDGAECQRMGQLMVEELRRYLNGETLQHEVTADMARHGIHRPADA